ncbi:hypothetical protein HK105_208424 [Polyrhizophydium stewartii]|uniref:Uncharacterized protein n=1 Tax=Polyrhizophydium stewartii TaxID=2732419 RepID=A0ABR4MXP2_9FUNG
MVSFNALAATALLAFAALVSASPAPAADAQGRPPIHPLRTDPPPSTHRRPIHPLRDSGSPDTLSVAHLRASVHPVRNATRPDSLAPVPINYHLGAPVLTRYLTVYLIYYGKWTTQQRAIVEDFVKGLGASSWYAINKKYYYQARATSGKVFVQTPVVLAGTASDNYSLGKALSGNALPNIIQAQINARTLPEDTDGVYFVMVSDDVTESIRNDFDPGTFGVDYCGYHLSWPLKSGKRIFYAMVGNIWAVRNACAPPGNHDVSPNGDPGVDGALSVLAHELVEAVTDPISDGTRAWEDANRDENADKCAYTYGPTSRASNGAFYNMGWNGRNYLIQQNWDPVKQACAVSA